MDNVILTERLALRHIARSDAARIVALINDIRISRNLARVPFPYTDADADEFFAWIDGFEDKGTMRAICLRESAPDLIGVISYDRDDSSMPFEFGYWLSIGFWGRGIMGEAARAMVDRAFTVNGVDRLTSCYFNFNPVSGRVLRRVGFEETGPCTALCRATGETVETTQMVLTKARWRTSTIHGE